MVIPFSSWTRKGLRAMWQRAGEWDCETVRLLFWWWSGKLWFDSAFICHIGSLKTSSCLPKPSKSVVKSERLKMSLLGGFMFTFLTAEQLLDHGAYLMSRSGCGCRQNCPQRLRGWATSPHPQHDNDMTTSVLLWLAAWHLVHGPRAMPHAFSCAAVHLCNVFNNDNLRKLHQHCDLFQVSTAFLFAPPAVLGDDVLQKYFLLILIWTWLIASWPMLMREEERRKIL